MPDCPRLRLALGLLALGPLSALPTLADPVYKSVDAQGRVTYSATPPPNGAQQVEEVKLQPGPSPAEADAAAQRLRALEQAGRADERAQGTAAQGRDAAIAAAQQELIRAKAELEQAKIQGEGDWQYLARGGRVLAESYFQRVADAEARVEAADKALQRARQGR